MSRIAIIGDIGGWTHRLDEAIVSLGGNPDAGTLPDACLSYKWVT